MAFFGAAVRRWRAGQLDGLDDSAFFALVALRPSRTVVGVRGLDLCGQATKGAWGMSWHQEAMKGVEDCEKLGGVVKQALSPRFPNQRALNP